MLPFEALGLDALTLFEFFLVLLVAELPEELGLRRAETRLLPRLSHGGPLALRTGGAGLSSCGLRVSSLESPGFGSGVSGFGSRVSVLGFGFPGTGFFA